MAHTPGPRRYQKGVDAYTHIVRASGNHFLLQLSQDTSGVSGANTRLIAAAPDLLAALLSSPCPRPANAAPDDISVEVCIARDECGCNCGAAIAKAKGQREARG